MTTYASDAMQASYDVVLGFEVAIKSAMGEPRPRHYIGNAGRVVAVFPDQVRRHIDNFRIVRGLGFFRYPHELSSMECRSLDFYDDNYNLNIIDDKHHLNRKHKERPP